MNRLAYIPTAYFYFNDGKSASLLRDFGDILDFSESNFVESFEDLFTL